MTETEPGRLIVLAAPSGAGKTTLVHELLSREPELEFSISYTTRPPRQNETNGEDYFFVDKAEFDRMRDRDDFLEHAEVFDNWYGTSEEYVQSRIDVGHSILLEIDWQGARQIRKRRSDALTVFIMPPSREELERRLRGRQTDSEEVIQRRLRDALSDMRHWDEFGFVVVNDNLDQAAAELAAIVNGRGKANRTDVAELRARVAEILDSAE
ncbi:MAG TPA: guanylate kinase [Gammaproteobacteria bacterium]